MGDYEVEFTDGSVICCHAAHEWYVYSRTRHQWCILETRQLAQETLRTDGNERRYNFSIPRTMPLLMPEVEVLVHPYILGAWLGDGTTGEGLICHSKDDWEVVSEIIALGYVPSKRWIHKDTGVHYSRFDKLRDDLREIGVLSNKHIPDQYLMGSASQRMELLAGLIDTDGNYSSTGGQYRFTNTNKKLVDQIAFLASSLGFKVGKIQQYKPTTSSSGIEGRQIVYVLAFSPTSAIPCRIPRKRATKLSEACRLSVVAVRKCDPKPGRCIQVQGGLYLVGERLITTHNSQRSSIYFPAWVLLLWPETRILLGSYEEGFAANMGGKVRDVVRKFGLALGIHIRDDTDAKGEWAIEGHGGGMVCKGRGGALTGRPADLLILDDMIKNSEEAQSPTILENLWDWYCTVAYSRLGPKAPIVLVGTRWGPKDLFGRVEAEAKVGGDRYTFVEFKAIAGQNDILGRKPGEALWPERVPLERLEKVRKTRPRWFKACWQGEPEEKEGLHFQPRGWPRYRDVGDAWQFNTGLRSHVRKVDCTILHAVDWAQSGKKKSNCTAIVTAALTPDGRLLVLDVLNEHLRYEENAPALDRVCQAWEFPQGVYRHPENETIQVVASDDDMLSDAMAVECRRYKHIPEIKRLGIRSRAKIIRAQAAIIRSQAGLFFLPEPDMQWYEPVCDQLAAFTGEEGAEDDIADGFGILGRLADEYAPGDEHDDYESVMGSSGYPGAGGW